MLIIKKVEYIKVPEDHPYFMHKTPKNMVPVYTDAGKTHMSLDKIHTEIINGIRYRNSSGEKMVIGCTEKAAKILGLQYDTWESKEKEMQLCYKDLDMYRGKLRKAITNLEKFRSLNFLGRLIFLLVGCPIFEEELDKVKAKKETQ